MMLMCLLGIIEIRPYFLLARRKTIKLRFIFMILKIDSCKLQYMHLKKQMCVFARVNFIVDIAVYKKTGLKSFETSNVIPQTYLSIADVRGSMGHYYEDIHMKQQTDKIYDILWDAHSGVPVMKERPIDRMTSRDKRPNQRYVDWKDAKLSASGSSKSTRQYASRPLPKPPKDRDDETKISTQVSKLSLRSNDMQDKQEQQPTEPTIKSVSVTKADTQVQPQDEKQQYHESGQHEHSRDRQSGLTSEGKVDSEQKPTIGSSEANVNKIPPRPRRKKSLTEDLLAPDQSAQRRELVPHMSVSDVQYWLKVLRLDQYTGAFLENEIDGALLLELDNGVLIGEFGMSKLHAIKLRKFATEGYMPRQ